MLKKSAQKYINNFKGFSKEIWILTLITFINRAGTMVLPFLSKYLKEDLHFSFSEVGTMMIFFGFGSMLGSWLGGKLSDKIGFYKIMIFSLFGSGIAFFLLQFVTSFYGLCFAMFAVMAIADMYRPAMFVSLGVYAKKKDRTRAHTLVRLAINLGFAAGPALGGLLIMTLGYKGIFWFDSITSIIAILVFWIFVKEKKSKKTETLENSSLVKNQSVYKDKPFWLFLIVSLISGILFFQLFTTLPLYHKDQFNLTELETGLLMMLNGLLIFAFEMPIVSYAEQKNINKLKIISFGMIAISLSIFLLLINTWIGILTLMMIFMSFGEMFCFPFSNSFAISRAPIGHEGIYMAFFTMSYSLAHILSAKIGLEIIEKYGYQTNWLFMGILGLIAVSCNIWVYNLVKNENKINQI